MQKVFNIKNLLVKALELHKQNKLKEAQEIYKKIITIDSNNDLAMHFYGVVCSQNGQNDEAVNYLLKAFELNPNHEYLLALAEVCNDKVIVIDAYKKLLELYPNDIQIISDLMWIYFEEGLYSETIDLAKKGIELSPNLFEINYLLAQSLEKCGYLDLACNFYIKSHLLNPENCDVLYKLGNIYYFRFEYEKALECFHLVASYDSTNLAILNSIAISYQDSGNLPKAIDFFEIAYKLFPDNSALLYNYGRALLANKDFEKGWKLYDDGRIAKLSHHNLRFPIAIKPKWDGEDLKNKTIYVYTAAGIGDDILYVRYLPELVKLGARVIVRPRKELVTFLKENDLNVDIIDNSIPDGSLEFDYQIPIMSLGRAFKTNMENIPYSQKYLKANEQKVQIYKEKYFDNDKFKVGIFWKGSLGDPTRIAPLEQFFKMAKIPNIKLYSLQVEEAEKDLQNIPSDIEIVNLGTTFSDFTDTAAAIENLDLLISIDTSVLHLAGAMGKATWAAMPKLVGWCWALEEETSPLYQSIQIFKQQTQGDWAEVFDRIYDNLKKLLLTF